MTRHPNLHSGDPRGLVRSAAVFTAFAVTGLNEQDHPQYPDICLPEPSIVAAPFNQVQVNHSMQWNNTVEWYYDSTTKPIGVSLYKSVDKNRIGVE